MSFDAVAFGEELVVAIKSHVARAVDPINARLALVEAELADLRSATRYRGVWQQAERYSRGSLVNLGVNLYHANADQLGQPGLTGSGWQLISSRAGTK
jgi:hypothetical protein